MNQSFNKNEFLQLEIMELLGPVRDPLGTVVPMSLLYVVVLLTGTIGNICTCIVIARNRYMHTATNFYLFSLAISDLLLLILGLPQELFMLWQKYPYMFGEFFCVVRGLSSETSTNASILTITAFTVERYVAICHPLKSHTMSQLPRAIKTILVIWAVSAICALPVAWQFGIIFMINKSPLRNISRQCGIKKVYFEYGFETAAIVFFLVPITLITILYVLIGINLRRSSHQIKDEPTNNKTMKVLANQYSETEYTINQRHNSVSSSHQKQIASRRSVIRMLVAVVIAFFFCYSPFHAQRVLATTMHRYKIKSPTIHYVYVILTHISGVTYYLSATINPILYQLMSRKFRIAFKDTFGTCFQCLRNDLPEITYLNIIGGVSSHQLSRVPSFNSNYSFRCSSFNLDQPKEDNHSTKSVHSFDPFCAESQTTDENSNNKKNSVAFVDVSGETKIPDAERNQNSRIQINPEPRFKQFLDVPSMKF